MTTPLTKKKFAFPSSKLLLFILIVVVTVATYIVPAGEYQYTVNEAGTTVVDASSYGYVQQRPVTLFRMFVAIAQGFIDGGQVIFLILFGYFWIYSIMRTGALNALISKLISGKKRVPKFLFRSAFCSGHWLARHTVNWILFGGWSRSLSLLLLRSAMMQL